jgi:hypothetical protein
VEIGMPAIVRPPGRERGYPDGLDATVETISADRVLDPIKGRAYYLVRLRAPVEEGMTADLRPGMPVDVLIVRGSRTLLDYLMAPLSELLGQALHER